MSHTQGKLRVGQGIARDCLFNEARLLVASCSRDAVVVRDIPVEEGRANAARPAHCWNSHDELVAQRDELLRALQEAVPLMESAELTADRGWPSMEDAITKARAAIAKAEGGAA